MSSEKRRGKLTASFLGTPAVPEAALPSPVSADREVEISAIDIVPMFNPRSVLSDEAFTDDALAGLAASIREHGVLQPIAVRREDGRFKLIAGERRLRASRLAGLTTIPVVVRDVDAVQALRLAIIENAQREDVDIVSETLLGFELLAQHTGLSQDQVVVYLHAVRKKRQEDVHGVETLLRATYGTGISLWAQRRALILKMTSGEQAALRARQIDVAACAALVVLPQGAERDAALATAIKEQLSAAQVRALVEGILAKGQAASSLKTRVGQLRKNLPRLARLEGESGRRAEQLMIELELLLDA